MILIQKRNFPGILLKKYFTFFFLAKLHLCSKPHLSCTPARACSTRWWCARRGMRRRPTNEASGQGRQRSRNARHRSPGISEKKTKQGNLGKPLKLLFPTWNSCECGEKLYFFFLLLFVAGRSLSPMWRHKSLSFFAPPSLIPPFFPFLGPRPRKERRGDFLSFLSVKPQRERKKGSFFLTNLYGSSHLPLYHLLILREDRKFHKT